MLSEEFSASYEELQLSSRLLVTNNWHNADTLSVDAAIGIFKQSGLTFKQLRDIWTIADKKGSGSLSKDELAVVIRLMGWVQAGQPLHEDLLASAGPMPFIKGITDSISSSSSRPAINTQIPPINTVDVEQFQVAFNGANPVLGILDREKVVMMLLRNDLSYNSVQKIMDLVAESHKQIDFPKFALALHLGNLHQSARVSSLPSVIPQYLQDQVSHFRTPDPPPLLPPASPRPSSSSASVTPDQPPTKSDQGHLPSASGKLESDLLLVKSRIEVKGTIDGEAIVKFMADYNIKPGDFAQLWSSSAKNSRLSGASLDLFLERLREKAAGQDAPDPTPYPTGTNSALYPVHVDDEFSTDPFSNAAQNGPWSPPFPVMKLDSHASSTSLPPYKSYSPSSSNVADYNPDAILPTSPAFPTNEPLSTAALEEIKAETATLIRHFEINFLRQSNQRNRLQSANKMLSDENLALQSKVQDLETKLSDCILPSEHTRLQHQYTQEVGRLTADLQRMTELLASLRDQHEAQEVALRECQANLVDSSVETERLRQSVDVQVAIIADLRLQLERKEKDIADLISKTSKPDMRFLYMRASLRESEASLAKAQDETKSLRQVIATHREDLSTLPVQSTAEPMLSSIADDSLLQSLACRHGRLSSEVKEVRQMMEQFIPFSQSRRTELNSHPMVEYRDNMDARSSVETIRIGLGSRPDPPTNHAFHEQPTPLDSQCPVPPVQNISTSNFHASPGNSTIHSSHQTEPNHVSVDSFRHSSSFNESAPGFDVVSAFEQSSQTSQATTIESSPYENVDDLGPFRSREMEHLEDAELQKIKAEGTKLSLQIERCLQQQITAQTNARSPNLTDRSHVTYASLISERDVERRQHQEEINLLAEKLRDKEAECKALKTQNPVSRDLAVAKDCVERLRETVARQNEVIFSLKRNRSYLAAFDPPSYEEGAAFSSSSVS